MKKIACTLTRLLIVISLLLVFFVSAARAAEAIRICPTSIKCNPSGYCVIQGDTSGVWYFENKPSGFFSPKRLKTRFQHIFQLLSVPAQKCSVIRIK